MGTTEGAGCRVSHPPAAPRGGAKELRRESVWVRHSWALLQHAGDLPLDVARTVLASHIAPAAHRGGTQRLTGGFVQCPKCCTPWIAGLCQARLLSCPRNPRNIRNLLRRERQRPEKLTSQERTLLTCFRMRQNMMQVTCLVCRHRKTELTPLPKRVEKPKVVVMESQERKKKKKKRGIKELNAGLTLTGKQTGTPDTLNTVRASATPTLSKRVERSITNASLPSPVPLPSGKRVARKRLDKPPSATTTTTTTTAALSRSQKEKERSIWKLKSAMRRDSASVISNSSSSSSLGSFLSSLF